MISFLIGTLLTISSLFLIALVLIQQGKGGGLAGAFGGMGGQSAFGTKAGDIFTRVTIITALVWIFFCMLAIKLISKEGPKRSADNLAPVPAAAPLSPGEKGKGAATTDAKSGDTKSSDAKSGDAKSEDKGAAPATTPATPMTPAATTPATPAESSTPAPATPAPSTPEPAKPAKPEGK